VRESGLFRFRNKVKFSVRSRFFCASLSPADCLGQPVCHFDDRAKKVKTDLTRLTVLALVVEFRATLAVFSQEQKPFEAGCDLPVSGDR
jgi:hypothetical protein